MQEAEEEVERPKECPCGGKAEVYAVHDCACGMNHIRYRRCSVCGMKLRKAPIPGKFVSRRVRKL